MEKLTFDLNKYKKTTKLAAYEWQDRCAQVIKELKIPKEVLKNGKKVNPQSSFFKWCKTNRPKFEAAYNYTREKNKGWLYFAWIMTHKL